MDPLKGEKKIYVTHVNIRQSIFFLLLKLVILELIFELLFLSSIVFLIASPLTNEIKLQLFSQIEIYFLLLAFLKFLLTIYVVLLWLNEYYEIRPGLITHRRGMIWKKEERYPLKQIRSVRIHQGVLGRIFHYGTLTLYDWDLARYATLYLIHNPIKYLHVLETLVPRASMERDIIKEQIIEEEK